MPSDDPVEVLLCDVTIEGDTRSAERPRAQPNGGRSYNSPEYRRELERVGWLLTAGRRGSHPMKGDVVVEMHFYRSTNRRVDIDNLCKLVMDAGTGVLWVDDEQIVSLHARKWRGVGRARAKTRVVARVRARGGFES